MGFISEIVILVQMEAEEEDVHELRVRYLRCAVASPTIMGITPVKYSVQRIIYVDRPRCCCCWDAFTFLQRRQSFLGCSFLTCHVMIILIGWGEV